MAYDLILSGSPVLLGALAVPAVADAGEVATRRGDVTRRGGAHQILIGPFGGL